MVGRTILIGDVHGCLEEMEELLRVLEVKSEDRIVFLGDIIDRGPESLACIRKIRENRWESVLGNHDEKALRWRRHEYLGKISGRKNPVSPPSESRLRDWESFGEDDLAWIASLPIQLNIGNNWFVIHGGLESKVPIFAQKVDRVIRVRYVNPDSGEMVGYKEDSVDQPKGTVYWTEAWKGPQSVVYGHAVHSFSEPREDAGVYVDSLGLVKPWKCVGVDTGCVFGGALTAMVFHGEPGSPSEFVQVQAKKSHHRLPGVMPTFKAK